MHVYKKQRAKYYVQSDMAEQHFEFSTDIFGNKKQHTIIFSEEKKIIFYSKY